MRALWRSWGTIRMSLKPSSTGISLNSKQINRVEQAGRWMAPAICLIVKRKSTDDRRLALRNSRVENWEWDLGAESQRCRARKLASKSIEQLASARHCRVGKYERAWWFRRVQSARVRLQQWPARDNRSSQPVEASRDLDEWKPGPKEAVRGKREASQAADSSLFFSNVRTRLEISRWPWAKCR